MRGNKDH